MQEGNPGQRGALPPELVDKGRKQLENEIRVLESWLKGLEETRDDNPESQTMRKIYGDMLYSRKELLNVLKSP